MGIMLHLLKVHNSYQVHLLCTAILCHCSEKDYAAYDLSHCLKEGIDDTELHNLVYSDMPDCSRMFPSIVSSSGVLAHF